MAKLKTIPIPHSIVVIGRRWKDREKDVFHTAQIIVDGRTVTVTPVIMGGGDYYAAVTAFNWLIEHLIIPTPEETEPHWKYIAYTLEIPYIFLAFDVPRKRDLNAF